MTQFAEGFERNDRGWILFPQRDNAWREKLFVEESFEHPAKMNLYLLQQLIRYTTKPGERIMDVTAGSGSVLIAALEGRRVVAIDISEQYVGWMRRSAEKMGVRVPQDALILMGDCRDYLPLECQSIIFSPPYAGALHGGGGIIGREAKLQKSIDDYRSDPRNLGLLSDFFYNQAMEEIYSKCRESLPVGGTLSLVIKDRIKDGKRVELGLAAIRMMSKAGWKVKEWHKWLPQGNQFTQIHRAHGDRVVDEEDIIIMERVQ